MVERKQVRFATRNFKNGEYIYRKLQEIEKEKKFTDIFFYVKTVDSIDDINSY